jgi:D-beta-D-heptose 7-phosphate kinase/D-beta-D-heptose 1-phosphate adenosyltransferase
MSAVGEAGRRARIESRFDRFPAIRVLVVGDLLLDDYRSGDVDRISPEAPVPVVRVRSQRTELGGAGNVARGIVALGANCEIVGIAGRDAEGDRAIELLERLGISTAGIVRSGDRVTPHKIRVVARGQQMLRIDREDDEPPSAEVLSSLRSKLSSLLPEVDVVILQDYDKGLFAEGLASWVIEAARRVGVSVVADPKHDLRRFHGASLIKPNLEEARAFLPGSVASFEGRRTLLEKIQRELGGGEIVVTRGAEGMTALDRAGDVTDVRTRPAEVFDVQGAGDTSIAVLALCRAVGAPLVEACIVANAAAAIAVGKMGTAAVDLDELRRRLPEALVAYEGGT